MAAPKQTDPQFKLRLTKPIKSAIEQSANEAGRSLNSEILTRIMMSYDAEPSSHLLNDGREAIIALMSALADPTDEALASNAKMLGATYIHDLPIERLGSLGGLRKAQSAAGDDPSAMLIAKTISRYTDYLGAALTNLEAAVLSQVLAKKYPGKTINEIVEIERQLALENERNTEPGRRPVDE